VSNESAQRFGELLGAGYVVTGSLSDMGDSYRFRVTMLGVETGAIVAPTMLDVPRNDHRIVGLLKGSVPQKPPRELDEEFWYGYDGIKMWSLGVNAATSFATPVLIGNINFTAAPLPFSFFEVGSDIGLFHGNAGEKEIKDVGYLSCYFYGRVNFFLPFEWTGIISGIGWYLGAGGGYMLSIYEFPGEAKVDPVRVNRPVFDAATGFYIGEGHDLFRVGYSLLVGTYVSNRLYVGYTYRIF
jgi:hypothetical protein